MSLFGELKRRNVFKVSVAYALVSWLLVQIADIVLPVFSAPNWVMPVFVLLLMFGFPIIILFAWAYEITPEGVKPTSEVDVDKSITSITGQKLNYVVITLLSAAVVFLVIDNYIIGEPPPSAAVTESRQAIAVLPFVNRSAAEEDAAFFADGIHDELLTRLAKIGDLRVISRTSVMKYRDTTRNMREIGEELGVGSILEGGVQRAGDLIRINVQLIDARTDEHLWAETYERELSAADIFAIQGEITTSISAALHASLSSEEANRISSVPTENIDALEAYFIGKQLVEERGAESISNSMEYFERAIRLDPDFAAAYAGLAEAWLELPNYSPTADPFLVRSESQAATERAVELDPDSPAALAALGWHRLLHHYDWAGADEAFRRALEIQATHVNALHWRSHLLSWQGDFDAALEHAERAVASDPLSTLIQANLAYIHSDAGHWDIATRLGEDIIKRNRAANVMANNWITHLRANHPEDAAAQIKDWAAATGRDISAAQELGAEFIRYQQTGEPVILAADLIYRLELGTTELPQIHASLGEAEGTIAALQQAHLNRTGSRALLSMKINPSYDFIRDDPRFIELLNLTGLAD